MPKKIKGQAILFGLNYSDCANGQLNGCINDVKNMKEFLSIDYDMPIYIYTDDVDKENTSGIGIISNLYKMACDSYRYDLDFIYIHYSGHGSYIRDMDGDEMDYKDEALVPSDYETKGLICDDYLQNIYSCFNPKTKIVCVFDCCHSGTIGDIKYRWLSASRVTIENINCKVKARVITISGCRDDQTSADAFNINDNKMYSGAMTSCMINVLRAKPECKDNIFMFIEYLQKKLKELKFTQIPQLCSTYNINKEPSLFYKT